MEGGERIGRFTYIGTDPFLVLTAQGEEVEIREGGRVTRNRADVFAVLKEQDPAIHACRG